MPKDFVSKVFTVFSGTMIAQILNILLMPVLLRLYQPESVGVSELFFTIVLIVATGVNGGFEFVIMLPSDKKMAHTIASLAFWIGNIACIALVIIALCMPFSLWERIGWQSLYGWHFLLPLSLWMEALNQVFRVLMSRENAYFLLSVGKVLNILLRNAISIGLGWAGWGFEGLILGFFFGQVASLLPIIYWAVQQKYRFEWVELPKAQEILKTYADFLKFGAVSTWLNALSKQFPFLLLPLYFATDKALFGCFTQAHKLIMIPLLFSTAVADVFYQRATAQQQIDPSKVYSLTLKLIALMMAIGFVPYLALQIGGANLWGWVLGEKYAIAGEMVKSLALYGFLLFVLPPLSFIVDVKQQLKAYFYLNLFTLISRVSIFFLALHYHIAFEEMISVLGISGAVLNLLSVIYLVKMSRSVVD